jgi:very-short-patch-repair endonuclease/predicted transcriptional regulator of viral defense system
VPSDDRRLLAIAARQHGCLSLEQLRACGLTRHQLAQRVGSGWLQRLGPRAFAIGGSPPTWEQQLVAAVLDLGPSALVSHRAAAALHGFDGYEPRAIELTVPRSGRGATGPWIVHTSRRLERVDRVHAGGLPATSASRTIIDLAASASVSELERAIDSAVRDGLSSPAFLARRLHDLRGRGRRGVVLLDELLVDSGGHSDLERRFLALVRSAGLPRPTCQRIFRCDGTTVARVDFSFEPSPVIVEVSGRRGHSSDAERARDAQRRNELQHLGFVVLEFTNDQVRRCPADVVRTLRLHLARPHLTVPVARLPPGAAIS